MTAPEDLLTAGLATRHNGGDERHLGGPALARLNPMRREFVFQYVLGKDGVRGVKYKSYLEAGYNAKDNNVASAAAYQLLQDPTVLEAVEELKKEIDRVALAKMVSWTEVAKKAQDLMIAYIDTLAGRPPTTGPVLLSANAIAIIKEALDRGVGKPVQPVEHDIGTRLDSLIKELAGQRPSRYTRPELPPGREKISALPPGPGVLEAEILEVISESERDSGGAAISDTGMGRERGGE